MVFFANLNLIICPLLSPAFAQTKKINNVKEGTVIKKTSADQSKSKALITNETAIRKNKDTVPLRGRNVFILDQEKVRAYKNFQLQDSIKLPMATRKDLALYQNALDQLKTIIQADPYQNADKYIDLDNELILPDSDKLPFGLSDTEKLPIPQLLLNQLTDNINMLRVILSDSINTSSSFHLLDMLIENNKTLSAQTVFRMGNILMRSHKSYPIVTLEIKDSSLSVIPEGLGYLITNDIVRKVGLTLCDFTIKPCTVSDFGKIVVTPGNSYLQMAGTKPEKVPFGKYHLFISDGTKIYYAGSKRINESMKDGEKIIVQL